MSIVHPAWRVGVVSMTAFLLSACAVVRAQSAFIDQPALVSRSLSRTYTDLSFSTPDSGYVFTDAEVLRTTDAGRSWQLLYKLPEPYTFEQLFFLNPTTAWIFAQDHRDFPGTLYRTLDGFATVQQMGAVFQRHDKRENGSVFGVFFLDAEHGWAAGGPYHAASSTDGGRTWTGYLVPRALGEPQRVVMFAPAAGGGPTPSVAPLRVEGLAETDKAMIRTTDGGATWQPIPNAPYGLADIQCVSRSYCMVLGLNNQALVSTDGGNTWQPQFVPVDLPPFADGRDEVVNLQLVSPSRTYIFGYDTHMPPRGQEEVLDARGRLVTPRHQSTSFLVTYDGSAWTRRNYDNIASLGRGQFVDDLNGWAVSHHNNIFRTTDGGQSWTTVQDYFRQIAALTPSPTPFVVPTPSP